MLEIEENIELVTIIIAGNALLYDCKMLAYCCFTIYNIDLSIDFIKVNI